MELIKKIGFVLALPFLMVVFAIGQSFNGSSLPQVANFYNLGALVTSINNKAVTGYDLVTGSVSATFFHSSRIGLFVGAPVASASTITTNQAFFHITGTAAITTINAPDAVDGTYKGTCLDVIADGAFTWTTAGNIATTAGTAVANQPYLFCYDSTTAKWYIK